MKQRWSGFFTLLELMVVVAVIAILSSLLLPALGKARDTAWAIDCASKQKQIGIGASMYSLDNDDYLLPGQYCQVDDPYGGPGNLSGSAAWYFRLVPYLGKSGFYRYTGHPISTFVRDDNLQRSCLKNPLPFAEASSRRILLPNLAWNFNLGWTDGVGTVVKPLLRNAQIRRPGAIVSLADAQATVFNSTSPGSPMPSSLVAGTQTYMLFPHQAKANCLHLDGHVEPYLYRTMFYSYEMVDGTSRSLFSSRVSYVTK